MAYVLDTVNQSLWEQIKAKWATENLVPLVRAMYSRAGDLLQLLPAARVYAGAFGDETPILAIENGRKGLRDAADTVYSAMPDTVIEGKSVAVTKQQNPMGVIPWASIGIELLLQGALLYAWVRFDDLQSWYDEIDSKEYTNLANALLPATAALKKANGVEAKAIEILKTGMDTNIAVINPTTGLPPLAIGAIIAALGLGAWAVIRRR